MAKQPTIFSFFSKSPQVKSSPLGNKNSIPKTITIKGKALKEFDLVWAKLEGYPWWPALICNTPSGETFLRQHKVHVQFFDDPPTRGWVKDSLIKFYGPPAKCGVPTCKDAEWLKAQQSAQAIAALAHSERADAIVCTVTSDESMDQSDFNESDKSKENVSINNSENKVRKRLSDSSEDSIQPKAKKRRIVLLSDSEVSEDEYKPDKNKSLEENSSSSSSGVDEDEVSDIEVDEPVETPVKKTPRSRPSTSGKPVKNVSFTPLFKPKSSEDLNTSVSESTKFKLSSFAAKETPPSKPVVEGDYPHTKLTWIKPENIRDKDKRTPNDPLYNPRTLFVPKEYLDNQTPALKQWWQLKSEHFDTILFFKMGKFYEFYNMDAITSIEELGLLMMRGEIAHTGFPEISYGRYSSILIEKGFKVARVEQTETPAMMEKRCQLKLKCTKSDKVVRREICQISSKGTRLPSVINGESNSAENLYLLSITEKAKSGPGEERKFGVAFIDTSIGTFHVGQFEDDRHISSLRTLTAHHPPAQIIYDRGYLSSRTMQLVKATVPATLQESLVHESQFWSANKTLSFLAKSEFFQDDGKLVWPEVFQQLASEGDSLGLTPSSDYELGLSALGGLIYYLNICLMEDDLLTRKSFKLFNPLTVNQSLPAKTQDSFAGKHMILDGVTLQNLEIFKNSCDGGVEGTLYEKLNSCSSAFGKRLLYCWLCSPLCNSGAIDDRLDAIEDLKDNAEAMDELPTLLKSLPDLEKLLSKIHSQGLKRNESHPDSRAILFEEQQYSKRKVIDFLAAVDGFKSTRFVVESFKGINLKSSLLKNIVTLQEDGGRFPNMDEILAFFDTAFDHNRAKTEGKIIPAAGVDQEYDIAVDKIRGIEKELASNLKDECQFFDAEVTYFGTEKRRFQLEVPDSNARKVTSSYQLSSQRKGFKRYMTSRTKQLLADMLVSEDQKRAALQDIARRIFNQFDNHAAKWKSAVDCVATLDVLMSLARYALQTDSVRPQLVPSTDKPIIDIREGRHPCAIKIFDGGAYVPNDFLMGLSSDEAHSPLVLITGPNMGGKSTLMRQTALLCLLTQIGSYVPAAECRISPIDRIFTRLGAWDQIYRGESTFYVEMAETAAIIQHATRHSLVIVDELGRGTSTYDGIAIAFSVVGALRDIGCRTLFSTHYHTLVKDFTNVEGVSLGHMECLVENDFPEDPCKECITFLYKFICGGCPNSYGFNVAKLADLPDSILASARHRAMDMEQRSLKRTEFSDLFDKSNNMKRLREIISDVKELQL